MCANEHEESDHLFIRWRAPSHQLVPLDALRHARHNDGSEDPLQECDHTVVSPAALKPGIGEQVMSSLSRLRYQCIQEHAACLDNKAVQLGLKGQNLIFDGCEGRDRRLLLSLGTGLLGRKYGDGAAVLETLAIG